MRRGHRGMLIVLVVTLLALPTAAAYHGAPGTAGLVVNGPIRVDGFATLRAEPGAAAFEGPSDVEVVVEQGAALVRIKEHREEMNPALSVVTGSHRTREETFQLPAPTITIAERGLAFNAALFTAGGVTGVALDAPDGLRIERSLARRLAPSDAARDSGLDPARVPDAFHHDLRDEGVKAVAPRGTVAAAGDFSFFLYDARVVFTSGEAAHETRLGTWTEHRPTGDVRIVRYALVEFRDARVALPFTRGATSLFAGAVDLDVNGTVSLEDARGRAVVGDRGGVSQGGGVTLAGVLVGSAWPTRGGDGALRFEARGDVTSLAVGSDSASFLHEPGSAATASALVLLAGVIAYFWPLLKSGIVAPLYARFNGAEVMDHAGRERAFAFVRENSGTSVNDVADGLGIAWSTASYHLRVLEREGFIVGERRGRHRRYFASGSGTDRDAVFASEHPTARRILHAVAASPGLSQKELAALAGVSPSTAAWHLDRLRTAGFVEGRREWRAVRYGPGPRFPGVSGRLQA